MQAQRIQVSPLPSQTKQHESKTIMCYPPPRSVVHSSSSGGGGVVSASSSSYSFSVRERCLPGPAPRRRSSSLLRLLEAKVCGGRSFKSG